MSQASTLQQQAGQAEPAQNDKIEKLLKEILERTEQSKFEQSLATVKFGAEGFEASDLGGLWRLANMYARGGEMVPAQFQGKPEACLIAIQMAKRCRVDVFAFMQSCFVVYGRPGLEAKLAIALLTTSGKIVGRPKYTFKGTIKDGDRACTCTVKDKETGEDVSFTIDWQTVLAEGWKDKKGSKWLTMPDQMFRYRSASWLINAHYPEVKMGLQTVDELEDAGPPAINEEAPPVGRESIRAPKSNGNGNGAKMPEAPPAPTQEPEQTSIISALKTAPMTKDTELALLDELERTGRPKDWPAGLTEADAHTIIAQLRDLPNKGELLPGVGRETVPMAGPRQPRQRV